MVALVLIAGCSNKEAEVYGALDGTWAGQMQPADGPYGATATFDWDDGTELLTGEVTVQEFDAVHTYAVRRWELVGDETDLHFTDVLDGTRGLELVGGVDKSFSGYATVRYSCPVGTCGWEGDFDLAPGVITTGGSAATPTGTTPTGTTPTGTTPTTGGSAATP